MCGFFLEISLNFISVKFKFILSACHQHIDKINGCFDVCFYLVFFMGIFFVKISLFIYCNSAPLSVILYTKTPNLNGLKCTKAKNML